MPKCRPRFGSLLVVLLGALVMGACSGPPTLQSGSLTQPPTIDGALSEWGGSLSYVDDESVAVSVVPTDSLLYVALSTQDKGLIRTVLRDGLIVWVDPTSKKKRTYGIRYPLGLRIQRSNQVGPASRSSEASSASRSQRAMSVFDRLSLKELGIIRDGTTHARIPAQFSSGVRAQVQIDPGALVYELAIPTGESAGAQAERQHGLRTTLGSTVDVGLATPKADDEEPDVNMPSNVPSVTGRQGRRRGGQRGRQRRRALQNQNEGLPTLDLWMRVVTKR